MKAFLFEPPSQKVSQTLVEEETGEGRCGTPSVLLARFYSSAA